MDSLTEQSDPYCLSPEQADELLRGRGWRRYAVLGDSMAEGLMEELPGFAPTSWADRLHTVLRRLDPNVAYLNLGRRGLLSEEVHNQQLKPALEFQPDLATVVCGGNDMFSPMFDRAAVEGHIDAMVAALTDAGATVFIFGLMNITAAVPEVANLKPRLLALNASARKIADRHGSVFVDLWDHPAADQRNLYSSDLMHMSTRGHAHIAAITIKQLSASTASAS